MKVATYFAGGARIGLADESDLWDLRELFSLYLLATERTPYHREIAERMVPRDMALFIRLSHGRMDMFKDALDFARENRERLTHGSGAMPAGLVQPLEQARLLAPVPAPNKVVCSGNSYAAYLVDQGLAKKDWPQDVKISFLKPPTALIGHRETILFPPDSEQWDYENELTIVIGRTCSDISPDEADEYIFGYTILNDACVRDIPQWTGRYDSPRGKAGDTFAPLGPWIVPTPYLAGDPNDLRMVTTVDGEVRQDDRTSGLLWPVQRIVAVISRYIRLFPGDVIATGSAPGNALISGKWLRAGQTVRCEMEGIGALENPVGRRVWRSGLPPLPA